MNSTEYVWCGNKRERKKKIQTKPMNAGFEIYNCSLFENNSRCFLFYTVVCKSNQNGIDKREQTYLFCNKITHWLDLFDQKYFYFVKHELVCIGNLIQTPQLFMITPINLKVHGTDQIWVKPRFEVLQTLFRFNLYFKTNIRTSKFATVGTHLTTSERRLK